LLSARISDSSERATQPADFDLGRHDKLPIANTIYEIRDGTGIGVFAPQFGPRRGFFGGITQKF
jgi:hypothetical protein